MKRIIVLLLALVMVVSVFAACGDGKTSTTPNKTTPKPGGPSNPGTDVEIPQNQQLNLDLNSIDHDGAVVTVFHWKPENNNVEFGMEADAINNDAVNDAIYKRNSYTEEGLGIDLEWVEQNSIYTKMTTFADKLRARISDPMTPVDIIAAQTKGMPCLITEGLLTDLNTYSDTLDLDKAWWPSDCQDALAVKDRVYFVSGDISANLLRMMTVLFVNKQILAARGYEYNNLMEDVKDYKWTLDTLIEMTSGIYEDLDTATAGPSLGDKFGLVSLYFHSDALFAGLGYRFMIKSTKDNEVFRLSNQVVTLTADEYVTKMKNWSENNDMWLDPTEKVYENVFKNGDSFFILHRAWYGFELQKTEIQYAVLPTPALDEKQGEYFTTIGNQYSGFGICSSSPDYDRAAETIQTLGYYGMNTTTPALFEVSFQGKFSKDDYTIEMFKIIREAIIFDTGRIYDYYIALQSGMTGQSEVLSYLVTNIISKPIRDKTNFTFTSSGDPVRRQVNGYIDSANAKLLAFIDQ